VAPNVTAGVPTILPVAGPIAGTYAINDVLVNELIADVPVALINTGIPLNNVILETVLQPPPVINKMNVVQSGNYFMTCNSQKLGCIRVSYSQNSAIYLTALTHVSSIGQTGAETIPGSWGCSESLYQRLVGSLAVMSKADFIAHLHAENLLWTWVFRIAGLILVWMAVYCCFAPIVAGADVIGDALDYLPCGGYLEDALEGVVGMVVCFMSCGIGFSCGFFVIAITWLFMRPLYGGLMLAGCAALICCVAAVRGMVKGRKKDKGYRGAHRGGQSDDESME